LLAHAPKNKKTFGRDYKSSDYHGPGKMHRKITAKFNEELDLTPGLTFNPKELEFICDTPEEKRFPSQPVKKMNREDTVHDIKNIFD
jgi:hypothetical protein